MQKFGILLPPEMINTFQSSGLFNQFLCKFYTNNMEYINSIHEKKIAVINHTIWFGTVEQRHETIKPFKDVSDHTFILHIEFNQEWIDYIVANRDNKTTYVISGIHDDFQPYPDIISNSQFFSFANQFYKFNKPELLQKLNPFVKKEYYFDFLPGRPKKHRFFVADYIKQNNLQSKIISSPIFNTDIIKNIHVDLQDKNYWEDEILVTDNSEKNWGECLYFGTTMLGCNIIPIKIYNNSAYSIVTETHTENNWSFFTEKIARPMLAHRLFIVFSGKHYLRRIKQFGYKTFDNVIDESYDEIDDEDLRWQMAADQIKYLCSQRQDEIIKKIFPILRHNFELAYKQSFSQDIKHLLETKCTEIGIF